MRCAPVLLLLRDGVVVSAGGACNGGGIHDGVYDGDSWRLVLIIASMVVSLHGKLSGSHQRLLYCRLGLNVPLHFSGDGGGDGVISGDD